MKKNNQQEKLNFFTITKKYWKEQLVLYFLGTLSFLTSFIIKKNGLISIYNIVKTGKSKDITFSFLWKDVYTFQTWQAFAWFMAGLIAIYFLIVMAHVYYRFYFSNKIIYDVKRSITNKFLKLSGNYDEKAVFNTLVYDTRNFADMVIFVPNQIFLIILSAIFTFIGLRSSQDNVLWWGIGYFSLVVMICLILNYFLYKKDLLFQKKLTKQTKKENTLINNRNLIIKKGLSTSFQKEYKWVVKETYLMANQSDFFYTSSFVAPSYLLIPLAQLIFLPFMSSGESFVALEMLLKLFDELKKMVERLWNYPYYFSAKKRLNQFLAQAERDDRQNNLIIDEDEQIENLVLDNVSFGYEQNQLVLNNFNLKFAKGKINRLEGANGFGKSTIIDLIMGLRQPSKGKIIINNKYQLSHLNLHHWRNKIAYAEHNNLVEEKLSTGQKQSIDLNNLFAGSQDKKILIFDEASSSLDKGNEKWFHQELEKLVKNGKLVILISH